MPVTETQIKMGYCPILFFVLTVIVSLPLLFTFSLLFQWHLAAQIILGILASALVLFVTVLLTGSFARTEEESDIKNEDFGNKPESELEKENVDNLNLLQVVNSDIGRGSGAPVQNNLNLNVMPKSNHLDTVYTKKEKKREQTIKWRKRKRSKINMKKRCIVDLI